MYPLSILPKIRQKLYLYTMKNKYLPIGIQDFRTLRENEYIYVDKTEQIFGLAKLMGASYFLSRPRRFGKSLLVNTFKELFSGSRELFKDLWIEDKWDWSKMYPVLHFSFDAMSYDSNGLEKAIQYWLKDIAFKNNITLQMEKFDDQFGELIDKMSIEKGKIVILVDEYDKPIIDYLEFVKLPNADINRKVLKNFYSVLKYKSDKIRFLFITGVSKFSKVSVFSDLNQLEDLTLSPESTTLVGYTQNELENYFDNELEATATQLSINRDFLLENMKIWYNGYSWDGISKVYNPFGTLNFLKKKMFHNFWFATGTPTFLLEQIKLKTHFNFENITVNNLVFEQYDIQNIDLVSLLFQTGYLTVKSVNPMTGDYVLDYPNKEVRESFYQFVIDGLTNAPKTNYYASNSVKELIKAFHNADLNSVREVLNTLLSSLPAETFEEKSEGLYHGLLHITFKLLGIYVQSEVHSSKGQADSIVITDSHVFIFEFKFNRSTKEALKQIKLKNYADQYRASGKKIVGIGVNFVTKDRAIKGWGVEDL
jgi:Predicted AAA-ATPase/PD-(D/E)XK nuclease superfamily